MIHSGRGGAGNIRSPSRNPADRINEEREASLTDKIVAETRGRDAQGPISTGRGGAGNISNSRSRSRSAVRGGGGRSGTPTGADVERERAGGYIASGRGGFGNITEDHRERNSLEEEKAEERRRYEQEVMARHKAEGGARP